MAYFPFMIDLKDRKALVVGGGDVALSKILKLRDFDADVTVVAKDVLAEIKEIENVKVVQKLFEEKDLNDLFFLVVAATNDREINDKIALFCKEKNILVNVVDDPERSSFVFPATLRRGRLTVAVSSGGAAPGAAAQLKNSIDELLSDNLDEILEFVAQERVELKRNGVDLELRKKLVRLLWDEAVAKGRPLTPREKARVIADAKSKNGSVSLVGAGAGDASLATIRAIDKLRRADVVLYDELIDKRLLDYAPKDAKRIPVGKRGCAPSTRQDDINNMMVHAAKQGANVVRLKGGDPSLFARIIEETEALRQAQVRYDVVPGVASPFYIPQEAGIPLTARGKSRAVHLITARTADGSNESYEDLASLQGTIVILMGLGALEKIVDGLLKGGKAPDTPIAVLAGGNASRRFEVRGTLENILPRVCEADVAPPAVIIIGDVAAMDLRSPKI